MQYISKYTSPLGAITLASNGEALTGLWFDGQKYFGANLSKEYKNVEYLNKQRNGLTYILMVKSQILFLFWLFKQVNFVLLYGKYC